jgi:hypothetical protein
MIGCRKTVSTLLEENRQKAQKAQEDAEKRKEEKKCRAAVVQATSLLRQEAEKRIEQKMDDKLQPVLDKLRSMEEQLQKTEEFLLLRTLTERLQRPQQGSARK